MDRLQRDGAGDGQRVASTLEVTLLTEDLATDYRWPIWGAGVAALGIACLFAVEMSAQPAGESDR